jgi:Ca2+-binding RTX toxin-like protein
MNRRRHVGRGSRWLASVGDQDSFRYRARAGFSLEVLEPRLLLTGDLGAPVGWELPSADEPLAALALVEPLFAPAAVSNGAGELQTQIESAMKDYANGTGPREQTLDESGIGAFLELTSVGISITSAAVDAGGQLISGSASLSIGNGKLFPDWDAFTVSIEDSDDDADDWAFTGTYDFAGGFELTLDQFSLEAGEAFEASAEDVAIQYDPTSTGPQTLVEIGEGTISFPMLKLPGDSGGVTGTLADLEIRTDGFGFGELSVEYDGEVSFGGEGDDKLLSLTGVGVGIVDFDVTFGTTLVVSGGFEVFAESAKLLPDMPEAPFTVAIEDGDDDDEKGIRAAITFASTGELDSLEFSMDSFEIGFAEYVTLSASDVMLDTGAADDELLFSIGEVVGKLEIEDLLSVGIGGGNLGITGAGQFRALPGFGVWIQDADFNQAMQKLGWPEWITVTISYFGLEWPDFAVDPSDFQISLSGSIDAMFTDLGLPITVGGSVTNARFDVGELLAGRNPLNSLEAASFNIGGELFGAGLTAEGALGIIRYDDNFEEVTDPFEESAGSVLYAGFGGGFSVPGFEVQMRLGFSQYGPLSFYGYADVPVLLEPNSGLSIGGFRAGAQFFTSLPDPVDEYGELDPTMLRTDEFAPPGEMSWNQWVTNLRGSVLDQVEAGSGGLGLLAAFTEPMLITGGGKVFSSYATSSAFAADTTVMLDTSGKIMLNADLEFAGGFEGIKGYFYGDLSEIASGAAQFAFLMDLPKDPPIVSAYGSLETVVLDEFGAPIRALGFADAAAIELRVTGAASLSAAGFVEATLEGEMVLTLSNLDELTSAPQNIRLTLDVSALASVTYLDDIGAAAGRFELGMYEDFDPDTGETYLMPELYGALYVQTDFSKLEAIGVYGYYANPNDPNDKGASALVRFNSSSEVRRVEITMPSQDPNAGETYIWDLEPFSLDVLAMGGLMFRPADRDWFSMEGLFYMGLNSSGLEAVLDVQVNVMPESDDPSDSLLGLSTFGLLSISLDGVVAVLDAELTDNIPPEYDVELSGDFEIALNTMGTDVVYVIPDALPAVGGERVFTVPGAPYAGDEAQAYLRVDAVADMDLLGLATLEGTFHMLATLSGGLEIQTHATSTLGLLTVELDGGMRLDRRGLVAALEVEMTDGIPDSWNFDLFVDLSCEINLTGQDAWLGPILVEREHGFLLEGSGYLSAFGMTLDGYFELAIKSSYIGFECAATMDIFNGEIFFDATGKIYFDDHPGLVINAGAGVTPGKPLGVPDILSLSGDARVKLNTRNIYSDGMEARYARVALTDLSMNLLNVLEFDGQASITVTDDMWRLALDNIHADLFGLATIDANGWIQNDGQYSLSLTGDAWFGGKGLGVNVYATLNLSQIGDHFSLFGFASGDFWFLGLNIADTAASLTYDSQTHAIRGYFSVRVWPFGPVEFDAYIGSISPEGPIELPEVHLAGANPAGVLTLYTGSLADQRVFDTTSTRETFVVSRVSAGSSRGEMLEVNAFGRTQQFDNIVQVIADGGSDVDNIRLTDDVTVPGMLSGGSGLDTLQGGSGDDTLDAGTEGATLQGGDGDDRYVFMPQFGPVTVVEEADAGDDEIDLSAVASGVTATLGSLTVTDGAGNTVIHEGSEVELLLLGPGDDVVVVTAPVSGLAVNAGDGDDTLIGPDSGATFVLDGADSGSVDGLTFTSVENLTGGAGPDTFTLRRDGSLTGALAGGDDADTLDYSQYGQAVTVDLESCTAPGLGNPFAGIEGLVGSGLSDELLGPDLGAMFIVDGADAGSVEGFTFASFENITGRGGPDVFHFRPGGLLAGDLVGGDGDDTLNYSQYGQAVAVDLEGHTASGIGGTFDSIETLVGSSELDELIGPDSGETFLVDGADAGSVAGLAFTSVENLTGGVGEDTFRFQPDGSLSGSLAGAAGDDRLDYTEYGRPVTLNLALMSASGIGGTFASIENVITAGLGDELIGPDDGAEFIVVAPDEILLWGIYFARFAHVRGGAGADRFVFGEGTSISGTLSGGGDSDTLDYSAWTTPVQANLTEGSTTGVGEGAAGVLAEVENVLGGAAGDVLLGDDRDNVLIGQAGDDEIRGAGGDDSLEGGDGKDRLYGDDGDDRLIGGADVDQLNGGFGTDTADYSDAPGPIRTMLWYGVTWSDGTGSHDGLVGMENVIGSSFGDRIDGDDGPNLLIGGDGDDLVQGRGGKDEIRGGEGHDRLYGDSGDDRVMGEAGDDLVHGGLDDDELLGGEGDDELVGWYGDDVMRGGAGNDTLAGWGGSDALHGDEGGDFLDGGWDGDTLDGGAGDDLLDGGHIGEDFLDYSADPAGVTVDLASGTGTDGFGGADSYRNVEGVLGSDHDDTLLGGSADDRILGGGGNDYLDGRGGEDELLGEEGNDVLLGSAGNDELWDGPGDDRMEGGSGNDSYYSSLSGHDEIVDSRGTDLLDFSEASTGVHVDLSLDAGQTQAASADGDTLALTGGFEDVVGSPWDDEILGNAMDNELDGGAGDDRLVGRGGADRLTGGPGQDTADYHDAPGSVWASLADGYVQWDGFGSWDYLYGMENLSGSAFDDWLVGDDKANVLSGAGGDDDLRGARGDDLLLGGEGDDQLRGEAGDDTLRGDEGDDVLYGSDGEDTLEGMAGNDYLSAGEGDDTLLGGPGDDLLYGWYGNDRLLGEEGNDTLRGERGDDLLAGGAGDDLHDGGRDTDTVDFSEAIGGVTVDLVSGTGTDETGGADTYADVENVTGSAYADSLFGDENDNVLVGGAGDDRLEGRDGDDELFGEAGSDVLLGGHGRDRLHGGLGDDDLRGGNDNDVYLLGDPGHDVARDDVGVDKLDFSACPAGVTVDLRLISGEVQNVCPGLTLALWGLFDHVTGSAHADVIRGNRANNILDGGAGNDWINGGAGYDRIVGGAGVDWLDCSDAAAGVRVYLSYGFCWSTNEFDWVTGMENVLGSAHDDWIAGDEGHNVLDGAGGDDYLAGAGGEDHLLGGDGDDTLDGGDGDDLLEGGPGLDTILPSAGSDRVVF